MYKKGFTLIETLVVVGLFAVVIAGAMAMFMMTLKSNEKLQRLCGSKRKQII